MRRFVYPVFLLLACVVPWLVAGGTSSAHPDIERQITDVDRLLAEDPDDPWLHIRRGELHRIHRDWDAAAADFRRAATLDPELAIIDFHLGRLHLDAGKPKQARKELDRFLAVEPMHAEARTTRARVLVELGRGLAAAADYDAALAVPGVRALPEHYLERAQVLADTGERHLGRALEGIEEGIDRLGGPVTLELRALEIEERMGRTDAAVARVERLAASATRKGSWLVRKAEILERAGRMDEARTAYEQAIEALDSVRGARRGTRASSRLREQAATALERLGASP